MAREFLEKTRLDMMLPQPKINDLHRQSHEAVEISAYHIKSTIP